jgi:hypothetical protein
MTDTATTGQLDDPTGLVVDVLLGICIIAAAFSLRPSDALALDAALFLLMNLQTWSPR